MGTSRTGTVSARDALGHAPAAMDGSLGAHVPQHERTAANWPRPGRSMQRHAVVALPYPAAWHRPRARTPARCSGAAARIFGRRRKRRERRRIDAELAARKGSRPISTTWRMRSRGTESRARSLMLERARIGPPSMATSHRVHRPPRCGAGVRGNDECRPLTRRATSGRYAKPPAGTRCAAGRWPGSSR